MAKKWDDKPKKNKDAKCEMLIGYEPPTNFEPIKPGNKATRTRGMNYRQQLWNDKVRPALPGIYDLALRAAQAGDVEMIKLFVNKSMPKNPIDKPLTITADANQQIVHIFEYAAEGHITPDEAVKLSTIVKDRVTIGEIKDFANKMTLIEQWIKDRDQGVTINAVNSAPQTELETISDGNEKELDSGSDEEKGSIT